MPKQLSPEEFEAMFGGGAPAEVPQDVGLGTMLGSGARRLGAAALGIGEAVGLSSGDWRREQQAIANADAQRYFEQTGAPRTFAEAQGLGETAQWLAGVGAQSLPSMIPVAAAGLLGGPPAAFAAGSALGLGDVLQNQREAGGRTDLTSAIPLGLAYGAADRFGIEGMFARRSLGTGVRALDALGAGQLDKLTGFTGAAARTAATGAKGMLAEGTAETLQEFANQAGRTAVSSETMFDPEAISRYQESFIAGGLLGGAVSGGLGGWRRSAADDGGATDLTARGAQPAVGVTPDQIKPEVQPFTQDWFNKALGVDETLYATDKNYAKAVGNLFEEGSGQFVQDTSSMAGHERELSMADAIMLRNGAIKMDDLQQLWQIEAIQGPMPRPGFVSPNSGPQPPNGFMRPNEGPQAPSADQAGTAAQGVDIDAEILARLGGKNVPKFARDLWEHMRAGGITPTDPEVADPFWNLAAKTGLNSQKQLDKVLAAMDAWAISNATPAAPATAAPQVGLQAPMAQPAAPAPRVFQQGVLQPAAPAGSAPVDLTAPRAPAAPAAAPAAAPVAPVASPKRRVQPVAGAPAAYVAPEGEAPASISPQRAALNLPVDMGLRDAAEIARATGQTNLAATLEAEAASADVGVQTADAREMPMDEAAADAVFAKHFERSKNPAQMVAQAKALIRARQAAPEGAKNKVLEAVGAALGLKKDTAYARVNEAKLVETALGMGYTREQAMDLLGVRAKTRGEATSLEKARNAYHKLQDIEPAKRTREQVQQMADLKGELERLVESEARAKGLDMSTALSEAGVTFDPDEGAGIGGDDANRWWSEAASRRAVDRAIGKLVTLGRQLQELRLATAELRGMGKEFRAGAKTTRDEAVKVREKLAGARAEAEQAAIAEQNKIFRAAWEEANKGKAGAKPPKVVRAPVVAESKATADIKEVQARWKAANRKLEPLSTEDLQTLLPYVRDTIKNTKLAGEITDLLKTRGVDNAVQVESAAKVPAQPEAGAGGEVGQKVPSAEKPAGKGGKTESRPQAEKVSAPAVVKTQRELAAEAWDAVATGIPGAPKFAELTRAQQTDFVEFGEDNWTPADVRREMQRMQPAAEVRKEATTAAQRAKAELHAENLGGMVAWQEGDMALILGYSALNGQPVYSGAMGDSRTSVGVDRYTGSLFTPEQKAMLVAKVKELEAAAAEKHATDPFIRFDADGLSFSAGVDPRVTGVLRGWKNQLGVKTNVYVTTIEDARADKGEFTGSHRAIGSAALNANEAGSARKVGADYYIAFTKGSSTLKMLETLAHELGHIHEREAFNNADKDTQKAIRAEHDKFVAANAKKTAREFVTELRARATGRATSIPAGMQAGELTPYWKSFSEWYADQVSRWAVSSDKPVGVVEQFFSRLGAAMRKFYYSLKGFKYLPNETMKQFLDKIAEGATIIDDKLEPAPAEPAPVEARVVDETVRPQVAALPAPQVQQLEKHYGLKRDSAEFLAKVKEDVVLYATRGAEAVAGAIRHIIKSIANGVLSVAMIFNPMHITAPEAFVVVPRAEVVTTTREVKAELPSNVKGMSEAGKQAYATLIPALKGKNGDKLITIADKPSGQIFVFDANGNLVVQKKTLFGLAKGDFYKGNNDLPKNRITPAGLFGLKLVDAAKGGSAAKTAGEYDFGKVFAFEDPDAVVTIMHSVWLKEKDAAKRSAALKDANPANSRYSFGCINVDKNTYKFLLDNYQSQMDGSKLFIVPDAQAKVGDFLAGNVPYDKMNRQSVGKTMETVTTTVGGGDIRAGGRNQNMAGKKEDDLLSSSSNRYGVPAAKATNPYTAKQLLKELKDFVRADIPGRKLLVVDDISELLTHPDRAVQVVGAGMAVKGAYGVASDGRAFLVANRIEQGQGRAKFMHEVGSHLGLEKLLPKATYNRLVKQVKVWADSNADTDEAYLAERALARAYKVSDSQTEFDDEILAYFLEEAVSGGIDPTADVDGGPLREWFRTLWNAFKTALIKLGFRPSTLTAQDVVDLAFGAARLELSSAYYGAPVDADRQRLRFGVAAPKKATAGQVQRAINQLPAQVQPAVRDSLDTMGNWGNKALDRVVFTSDLIGFASQAGLQAAKSFGDNLARRDTKARELEREVEKIADLYALVPEKDRGLVPEKGQSDTANQFIFDSTREGKWGFGKYADRDMRGRFDALSAEAQAFVKAVFDHGDKMLALKKKTVMDHTNTEYDALIAAAAADGDAALEAKLKGEKQAVITRFKDLFATQEGRPYAPIKRMGTYAVVAKSQAYRDAEAAGDQKQIQTMQKQADHYHVSFTEGRAEARELARQLQAQGHFGRDGDAVDFFEREANMDALFGGDSVLRALTKLQSQVEAKQAAGEAGAAKLRRMVTDLYLEALAENSARKTEMKRRGVAGEVDMLRSFTTQGRADANFLASVEYNRKIQDSIQAMRKERDRGGNRARKAELFNELTARYAQSMEDSSTPALRKLLHLSSVYYLMTSPAYYVANLTQPWMMSVPVMAGKHGYAAASSAQFEAYKDLKAMIMSTKLLSGRQFDYSLVGNTAGEKNAIQELANRGRIDIGMETELGEFRVEGAGPVKDRLNKVNKGLRMLVQKGEILNRMSTALAAYRLELARNGGDTAAATDYADRILTETHGDYGRFNAPRMFNTSVGKVALQFRKFQLIQLSYYAKMLRSAGFTTQEQRAATKALTYSLLHTAAFAGLRGLPGFAAAQFLAAALLGDEDKKYDLAAEIESAIGDKDWARLVMRGAPTLGGLDLSGSVGAGNALSVMPFSNADLSTPSGQFEAFGQLVGGAGGGMVVRGLDGLGLMKNGDWYKGLEMLMPKGLSSAMQAYRIADEGMTRRNGDVILPPKDVSELETFWKALGFTTPGMSETYENRQRFQDIKDRFTERSSKIKNAYARAARERDSGAMQEARQSWSKLQQARRAEGFQPQPMSNLLKAPQEQAKREKQTVGGVQFRPNEKAAALQVAGE